MSTSTQHGEFWKRLTFALVAVVLAFSGLLWNQMGSDIDRNTDDIRAVVTAVSELTATVSSLAATVEAIRERDAR